MKRRKQLILFFLLLVPVTTVCIAQEDLGVPLISMTADEETVSEEAEPPPPPQAVTAVDVPNDDGTAVEISIKKSPADNLETGEVESYVVFRREQGTKEFEEVKETSSWAKSYQDELTKASGDEEQLEGPLRKGFLVINDQDVERKKTYFYMVKAFDGANFSTAAETPEPVTTLVSLFHTGRTAVLIAIALFFALIFYFLYQVRRKAEDLYIRRIPGIDAIEEAIGRATEMGRPVLFVPGIGDISDIQTIASILILGEVSEKAARYSSRIIVPNMIPFVMTVAQEVVKQGYMNAGNPDGYDEDDVMFLTSEQFAYAAGVNGIMLREKPAANLLLGTFFAESLLLAETGFAAGAIQVAGTAEVTQLPFFIAACDYTLIGEELFAASAYLSREPQILSTLKATDWYKMIAILLIIVGTVLASLGNTWLIEFLEIG